MKQTIRQPSILHRAIERAAGRAADLPTVRLAVRCAGYALSALVLSGAGLLGQPLPLAAALIAVMPAGAPALCALGGAMAGYAAFWGLYAGLEGMAAAILVFSGVRIFQPTPYAAQPWFAPAAASGMTAVIGGVFLLAGTPTAVLAAMWCARTLLAAVGAIGFRRALQENDRWAELFLGACLVMGLSAVRLPAGMTLGAIAAAVWSLCASGTALGAVVAGVCGLAIDLPLGTVGASAAFLLGGALCLALQTPGRLYRAVLFTVAAAAGVLVSGGPLALIPSTALGAAVSLLLPPALFQGQPAAADQTASIRARLSDAAGVLDTIGTFLQQPAEPPQRSDTAEVFDRTADEICRLCGGYVRCWEQNAAQTYQILNTAAPQILARGMALREDFPPEFRCCRLDSFLRAVNCEIDELRMRRLCQARAALARESACGQYSYLASLLRACAQSMDRTASRPDRFRCEIGARTVGRHGRAVSGDRCASVRGPGHRFYIVLCDGMGAGVSAQEESQRAISVLCGMLRAGASAADALSMLDGAWALRTDGGFATVDLFEADLFSGECTLYKQGAAPSYYRKGRRVGQVGTATAPPGYAAGGDRRVGQYSLSLSGEDLLVMASDGLDGAQVERQLAAGTDAGPAELADSMIAGCTGEDDATAVVIRVRPRASA